MPTLFSPAWERKRAGFAPPAAIPGTFNHVEQQREMQLQNAAGCVHYPLIAVSVCCTVGVDPSATWRARCWWNLVNVVLAATSTPIRST
jgi:hypothetical protein